MATYKMLQIPPNVVLAAKGMMGKAPNTSQAAAAYLETTVNQMASQGWEFHRIDPIGVGSKPGCLLGLIGFKATIETFYVITFRKS